MHRVLFGAFSVGASLRAAGRLSRLVLRQSQETRAATFDVQSADFLTVLARRLVGGDGVFPPAGLSQDVAQHRLINGDEVLVSKRLPDRDGFIGHGLGLFITPLPAQLRDQEIAKPGAVAWRLLLTC